jgi:hypothetical protein
MDNPDSNIFPKGIRLHRNLKDNIHSNNSIRSFYSKHILRKWQLYSLYQSFSKNSPLSVVIRNIRLRQQQPNRREDNHDDNNEPVAAHRD